MPDMMILNSKKPDKYDVVKIIAIYAIFSSMWIYFSDRALGLFISDQTTLIRISVFKGFFFVIITSILLYQLVSRYLLESSQLKDAIKKNEVRTEQLEQIRAELEIQNTELQKTYHELELESSALHQAMEDLREKELMVIQQSRLAAMGEMLGNIAHQWRQPFNIMGLMVQDLGLSYESGEFSKELLDSNIGKVMEILLHLSKTIDDFSNFATPDKEKSLFKVDQVIIKTISMIEESFRNQRISINVNSCNNPQINGYPHEYAQVLLNILMNARDAFQESKVDNARITIRSCEENGRSVVMIADNAGGIKTDILGKIFEPYFTTKDLGKGTGVGLFISKNIIEKNMGGRLSACNTGDGVELRIEV